MQYNPSQMYNGKFKCNIAMLKYKFGPKSCGMLRQQIALNMCTNLNHDMIIVFEKKPMGKKYFLEWYKDV